MEVPKSKKKKAVVLDYGEEEDI